ncbi:Fructokinase [bacterium YEK0313]|nr:Fructokinase [bacterium YEK0313]
MILLGGGMGKIDRLYGDLAEAMRTYVFSDIVTTPVLPPLHGDSSGVRGAAWLWPPA